MHNVGIHKLSDDAVTPFKGTETSACYDIRACFHKPIVKSYNDSEGITVYDFGKSSAYIALMPNELALIPTGLIFCLPKTHHLKFYSRSGNVWKRMLIVANQPAVIDSDYTKESFVLLHNQSGRPQTIVNGDAIAQCELCINMNINFAEFDLEQFELFRAAVYDYSSRDGGFGSTDR